MDISNKKISDILRQYADLLEIYADNPYRIRAYRRAARTILKLNSSIQQLVQENADLTLLPNIGSGISRQLYEIIKKNKMPTITKNKDKEKPFRNELLQIEGIGKKRIELLKNSGITTISELKQTLLNENLSSQLKWVNKSFKEKLLYSIEHPKHYEKLIKYNTADLIIKHIQEQLFALTEVIKAIPASYYRRKVELVGNVDWIIQTTNDNKVIQSICALDLVKEIVKRDERSVTVLLRSSLLMTFHLAHVANFDLMLLFYTGSSAHITALQMHAKHKKINLTLNSTVFLNCNENEIYAKVGLPYIEPELRENLGEISAAENNHLPELITLDNIKGDLHSHTNETDGLEPLEIMVQAAIERGYEYFAITDHSKRLAITNGLDEKRLLNQIELINKLNDKYPKIKILKSIEVDILEDGFLDLSNEVLKELDITVCSIHSKFNLPEHKQTARIIRAMDNPYFNILGHMTGRLLSSRPPYQLQVEKILMAAKERNCFIELNSQPARLDLNYLYCKQAKEIGVKIAISSDAHSVRELSFMQLGINQARKGWLEKEDVINTRPLPALRKLIKR